MNAADLARQLRALLPRGRVLTSAPQLAGYASDGLGFKAWLPDAVVIPADAQELAQFMRGAVALNLPVIMRGAGTSLSGGPVAAQGGVVVHTSGTVCFIRPIPPVVRSARWAAMWPATPVARIASVMG